MSAMTFGTFHRRCAPGELAIILSHFEEVKSEIHLLIYQRRFTGWRDTEKLTCVG
jgi:hypothetical protein